MIVKLENTGWTISPPSFRTHLNYVSCMNRISKGIKIKVNLKVKNKIKKNENLSKKLNLIKLIKKSLEEEYKIVSENEEFAEVCNTWIAVKSYYLIFNLCLILCYLINTGNSLDFSHKHVLNKIKNLIKSNKITFNKGEFNKLYPCKNALEFKIERGEALKKDIDDNRRIKSIVKKLANYKLIDFKRSKEIPNFRKKINRKKRDDFIKEKTINLFEFFYWYRIKANYRDLEFLNAEVSERDFFNFYESYVKLTTNFYFAFKKAINDLSEKRLEEQIIK